MRRVKIYALENYISKFEKRDEFHKWEARQGLVNIRVIGLRSTILELL